MSGPIRFVFMVLWFGIGLGVIGTLKDCTMVMAGKAARANQQEQISLKSWNRMLMEKPEVR